VIKKILGAIILTSILLLAAGCFKEEPQKITDITFADDVKEVTDEPGSRLDDLRQNDTPAIQEIVDEPDKKVPQETAAEEPTAQPEKTFVPEGPTPTLSSADDVWKEIDAVVEQLG